jgi:alpha-L-fucosidase
VVQVSAAATQGPFAGKPYDAPIPRKTLTLRPRATPPDSSRPALAQEWFARIRTSWTGPARPALHGRRSYHETAGRFAHYYNQSRSQHGGRLEAVYTLKDWRTRPGHGDYVEGIGVQDVERGGLAAIKPMPWQTDTSIGDWFYNRNWKAKDTGGMYRSPAWVVRTLVDIVSKNGNMLLNVIQRPDGSLDPEVEQLLAEVGAWMTVNGEAIYSTRPWAVYGEGATTTEAGHFKEDFAFSASDVRFTQSKDGRTLYAVALGWPADGTLVIRSLASSVAGDTNKVERVELLGHKGPLVFEQTADGLKVTLPGPPLSAIACAFRVSGRNLQPVAGQAK